MPNKPASFRQSFIIAIVLHCLLLAILFFNLPLRPSQLTGRGQKKSIIQAKTINQQQLQSEIRLIKKRKQQKQQAAESKLRRLQEEAKAVKQARKRELRKLAKLKQQRKLEQRRHQQQLAQQKALAAKRRRAQRLAEKKAKQAKQKQQQKLAQQQKQLQQQLMQQQLQTEQQTLSAIQKQHIQGIVARYKAQILQAISQQWLVPNNVNRNLSSQFLIHVAPGGVVLNVKLLHSSGNATLDRSAKVAIFKASPLPVPKDPAIFDKFRELRLTVSPKELIHG